MGLQKCLGQAFSSKHLHESFLGWTCEEIGSHHLHLPNKKGKLLGKSICSSGHHRIEVTGTLPNGNFNKFLEAPCKLD